MKIRKKRVLQKYLFKYLKEQPVKKVRIKDDWVSLEYDGKKLKNRIIIKKHERRVGSWSYKEGIVFVDDGLVRKDRDAVALHETIEKYVTETYGFPEDLESHKIATLKEREFFERLGGNWKSHQIKVGCVWKEENE